MRFYERKLKTDCRGAIFITELYDQIGEEVEKRI